MKPLQIFILFLCLSKAGYAQTAAETYFVNAEIQLILGDTLGAIINYHNVTLVSKNAAERYHCQGYIKYLQKDYIGAIADYTQAVSYEANQPANATIYFDRALAHEKLGHKHEALEDYGRST